jgi:hypothetical protein
LRIDPKISRQRRRGGTGSLEQRHRLRTNRVEQIVSAADREVVALSERDRAGSGQIPVVPIKRE